jgi:hypothetical protein
MLPQLVRTKRDRLMRLAASTVPQALQHWDLSTGLTTMIRGLSAPTSLSGWGQSLQDLFASIQIEQAV